MVLRGLLSRPKDPFISLLLLVKNFDRRMSSISFTNVLFCASIYTTIRCQVMMLKRGVWCFPLRKCWGRGALRDSKEGKNTPLDWRPSPQPFTFYPSHPHTHPPLEVWHPHPSTWLETLTPLHSILLIHIPHPSTYTSTKAHIKVTTATTGGGVLFQTGAPFSKENAKF